MHPGPEAQVVGDPAHDHSQVAGGGIAVATEHTVESLFAEASLTGEFFKSDFGMHQVAEHGEAFGRFSLKEGAKGLGEKRAGEFAVAFNARHHGCFVISG